MTVTLGEDGLARFNTIEMAEFLGARENDYGSSIRQYENVQTK